MSNIPGIRDTYFHEAVNLSQKTEVPEPSAETEEKDERVEPLEARGEDPDIDLTATAHALYQDAGEHRRLSDVVLDTARRLSEPDAFDSLFT